MPLPSLPSHHVERPFLQYWARTLLDPNDPQNPRWLALELEQVRTAQGRVQGWARDRAFRGARVLDVGCQTGALGIAFAQAGAEVVGVDVEPKFLHAAQLRSGCYGVNPTWLCAAGEALPFETGVFDFVSAVDIVEHVASWPTVVRELARVLAPGGTLYLQGPNRWSPHWWWRDPHYGLAGISMLPEALARWYVTRVRGRPRYDVSVFPVGSSVYRALREAGLASWVEGFPRGESPWWALHGAGMFSLWAEKPRAGSVG